MTKRPYQSECLDAIRVGLIEGVNRQLVVLPTASGKTIIFSQLPEALRIRRPDKMLVLVQAEELVFQAAEKLKACNPGLKVGIEKAEYKSSPDDDIIVASVQSLSGSVYENDDWRWGKRIQNINREAVRYVVVDESHHSISSQYAGVLSYFGVYKPNPRFSDAGKFLLGVTATPNRSDNKGLEALFDKIVFTRDIRTMIKDGWLAPIEAHRVDTTIDISQVDVRRGDYVSSQLEKEINVPERNNLIVSKYLELGEGAPFLAFTCDIQHTVDLTNTFRERGIECYGIASKSSIESPWLITKSSDRKLAIEKYNAGEFRGLLSCQALLEGFDAPRAMVGLGADPTTSGLRFTQGVGRILRPYPAPEASAAWSGWRKRAAIWLDFCDNSGRHSLITAPSLFGLKSDFNAKGKDLVKVVEEIERIKAAKPALNIALYNNLDAIKGVAEKIDLFAVPTVPPEIQRYSQFSWTQGVTPDTFQLVLPDKGMLSIKVNALGTYEVARHVTGIKTPMGTATDLQGALKLADKSVPAEAMIVLKSDAGWRKLAPTDSQMSLLRRLYPEMRRPFANDQEFAAMIASQYSRGQVSQLIAQKDTRAGR